MPYYHCKITVGLSSMQSYGYLANQDGAGNCKMCSSRKYPYPTTEGTGNSGGWGGQIAQEIPGGRGIKTKTKFPEGRKSELTENRQ